MQTLSQFLDTRASSQDFFGCLSPFSYSIAEYS
jgi:hypothetical protein